MEPSEFAHMYHTVYQRLAPKFGMFASGLEYGDLPGQTKMLDEAVAADMLERLRTVIRYGPAVFLADDVQPLMVPPDARVRAGKRSDAVTHNVEWPMQVKRVLGKISKTS